MSDDSPHNKKNPPHGTNRPSVSVVIPTYRKEQQLVYGLKHNLPLLDGCEVIVVNDYPDASIDALLTELLPITLIEHEENTGFSGAVNTGISAARGDCIMLLNSDVLLTDQSFWNAAQRLQDDPELCAVAFGQVEDDGSLHGKNRIFWHNGLVHHDYAPDTTAGPTAWAEASAAIFSAAKLSRLKGFNQQYSPFYWEDIDISYRAWRAGYQVMFDPSIVVEHKHEATIGSYFSQQWVKQIAFRNQVLFARTVIEDVQLQQKLRDQMLPNIGRLLRHAEFSGVQGFLEGIFTEVHRLPIPDLPNSRTDQEVLDLF